MKLSDLHKPFDPDKISWRLGTVSATKKKGMALAYIDARDVMERLDEVCGPENWQDTYVETAKGRMICIISLKLGDAWIAKSDGAGDTDIEGDKGAISDAFKRAAVKWGVGRYLYDLKDTWVEVVDARKGQGNKPFWVIPDSEKEKLRGVLLGARVPDTGSNIENRDKQSALVNEIRQQGDLTCLADFWDNNWTRVQEFKPAWRVETFMEFLKHGLTLAESVQAINGFLNAYEGAIKAQLSDEQRDDIDEQADKQRNFLSQAAA